jgi:transcription elongation factor Elf1
MSKDRFRDFACPRCTARYKIVRVMVEQPAKHDLLQCIVCEQELAPTENDYILKYFLVSRPAP